MRESSVEGLLKSALEGNGFKVLKLTTPGTSGAPDRLILRPSWSPGAPYFVECKRPGKTERLLQEKIRDDWRKRGALVLDVCDTYERVAEIQQSLMDTALKERTDGR